MYFDNIMLILAVVGLFQAVFLCVYLVSLKKVRKSNIFLILILLGLTIRIGKSLLNYYIPLEAWERNIGISGIFIVGPSLLLYGVSILDNGKTIEYRNYIHYLPWLVFLLSIGIIPSNGKFDTFWNYAIVVTHLGVYLIISWNYLIKRKSKIHKGAYNWYRNILFGTTLVCLYYLGNFLNINIHYVTGPVFFTFLIYAFSYLYLNRQKFDLHKYENSHLDYAVSKSLFEDVKKLFTDERLFLKPNITLKMVAEKLSLSPRYVSQVINENRNQNFKEFVNQYRIENAKELLLSEKYLGEKIATIAYDSGFGTVTSFNIAFKKKTGMTPSGFRRKPTLK